jgi:hypothetical protein
MSKQQRPMSEQVLTTIKATTSQAMPMQPLTNNAIEHFTNELLNFAQMNK